MPKIIIVGTGALGSEVCRQLADACYTHVILVDPDRLEQHNTRSGATDQVPSLPPTDESVLPFKVDVILHAIRINNSLPWTGIVSEIADVGLFRIARNDMILSCTDSALARVETARAARILNLPMIDAGVMSDRITQGRVAYFAPRHEAACYLCGISEGRRADILAYAGSSSLGCRVLEDAPSMTGTQETLRQTAAAMLALLKQWQINGDDMEESFARRIVLDESHQWSSQPVVLKPSVSCSWHLEESSRWSCLDDDEPIRNALSARSVRLQLLWPYCFEARCLQCGSYSKPLRRVAWVRRKMICAICGASGTIEPLRTIDSLGRDDLEADLTPRQLGWPSRHLYLLRGAFVPGGRKGDDEPVA